MLSPRPSVRVAQVVLLSLSCAASVAFAADKLPVYCGEVGARPYQQQPPEVARTFVLRERGAVITVTNSSDVVNGDVSGVTALLARPGPDGISLREAVTATNNERGVYTIRFDRNLKGASILLGDRLVFEGGNVTINGDIDGDGNPDVTVRGRGGFGLEIASSGNTLHALAVEDFGVGVGLAPLVSGNKTFTDNTVSNLVMRRVEQGVAGGYRAGSGTGYRWINTFIAGNAIEAKSVGIGFWLGAEGDLVEATRIVGNRLSGGGIVLAIGPGPEDRGNRAVDTLIAYNTIAGAIEAVSVYASFSGSQNLVDGVRIIGNRVRGGGVAISTADNIIPGAAAEENVVRNVLIMGNVIEGSGIGAQAGFGGARNNAITDLSIIGNVTSGIGLVASARTVDRPTEANEISRVVIRGNTVQLVQPPQFPWGGGVSVQAGQHGGMRSQVRDVWISQNEIDADGHIGINITGGWARAADNQISNVQIWCNQVARPPALAGDPFADMAGITLAGGVSGATGNRIRDVRVQDNLVAGVLDVVSVHDNPADGSSGNIVRLDTAPAPLLFAPFLNGPAVTSELVLSNLSTTAWIEGRAEFFDESGLPLTTGFLGFGDRSSMDFSIAPEGVVTFTTDGQRGAVSGSVRVTADGRVGGFVRLRQSNLPEAVVAESKAFPQGFSAVVRRSKADGLDTSITMLNAGHTAVPLDLLLRDLAGSEVTGAKQRIENLPPGGKLTRSLAELFPSANTDNFQGTVTVLAAAPGARIAGTVLETGMPSGQVRNLPVMPAR
ncbi:MAG: hypothetical protein HY235_13445 [Acidobacteria bacterium]|nr:hypothetical protein [Acidobacteriota bacterium]